MNLKLKILSGLALLAQTFSLDLSADLNDMSLPEVDNFLKEASSILNVYPNSMAKINDFSTTSENRRSKRSYNVFALDDCKQLPQDKLHKCLRILGVCGQFVEVLREKLITINLNVLQDKHQEQVFSENGSPVGEMRSASTNSNLAAQKLDRANEILERVLNQIADLKDKTDELKHNVQDQYTQRSRSGGSSAKAMSSDDMLSAFSQNSKRAGIVEVYQDLDEALRSHQMAKRSGAVSLGKNVNEMVHYKNELAKCSTIRLKNWSRLCEPCVTHVEEGAEPTTPPSEDEEHTRWTQNWSENLPIPDPDVLESITDGNDLGLNFADI